MTLDTFFEKFELFADAPDAVAKMREFILHLAVTGKLSELVKGDESVESLLEALAQSKSEKTKSTKHLIVSPDWVPPFEIPSHWSWTPLTNIVELGGGMTPSKAKSVYWDGDINWFSSKDIKTDELFESSLKITAEGLENTSLTLYPPGCLFIVARSGILKHTLPVSINRAPGTSNQDLKVLTPFIEGIERYLQIMFRGMNDFIISDLVKTGMTVQSLKYTEFAAFPFPLPPLAEQKRIVAKVDELMALCDALEAQQEERDTRHAAVARATLARFADAPTVDNLNLLFHKAVPIPPEDLRKSILTLAVQGKLVPQDPADENVTNLLEQISEIKVELLSAKKLRGSTDVEPINENAELPNLPKSWNWVKFGQAMINRDGERKPVSRDERSRRSKNFDYYGASGVIDKIDGYLFDKPLLLIGEDGANLINRSTPIAFIARGKYWVNNHAHVLDGISESFLEYVAIYINSIDLKPYVTGSAQPKMNQAKMNSIPLPIPPLAEQRRIVAKVDQLMTLVDELERQLATSRDTAAKLLEAVVTELTSA